MVIVEQPDSNVGAPSPMGDYIGEFVVQILDKNDEPIEGVKVIYDLDRESEGMGY